MADWYGACRTNEVEVMDVEAVEKIFEPFQITVERRGDNRVALFSDDEYGGYPSSAWVETDDGDDDDELEFDFSLIVPQLIHGQVLIVMCSGAEKLRYVTGEALAIAWDGRTTYIDINDIYDKAAAEFGVEARKIGRAEY